MTAGRHQREALQKRAAFIALSRRLPEADEGDDRQMVLPHVTTAAPVEKTIWGSPAGKKRLAARLVKLIPAHKVYVEPFAGSGAVFFEKPASESEVLGDADPEIAAAFKTLSMLSDREFNALEKKDWVGRRTTFDRLRDAAPRGKLEKLHRFLYLSHFAYGKLRGKSFNPNAEGVEARTLSRIERFRDRLRGVKVRSSHYADVVKEFDGKDTFFFLDPPYPGHNVGVGEDQFDEAAFRKVLDGIKGKFLVTYGTRGELDTSGFHVRKIRTRRSIATMRGVGGPKTLPQLLIANYKITEKALGPYLLEEVEGAVELAGETATELDRAYALTKALAPELDEPSITALASEVGRVEGAGHERSVALAGELLPLANRLSKSLKTALPTVAKAFERARPVLEALTRRSEAPVPSSRADSLISAALEKRIALFKTEEERYVLGIVLEPETVDAQNDIYSSAEVREAAHKFMEEYRNVGLMHQGIINKQVKILESYLAPVDFELGGGQIKKGTWLLAVHVLDDGLWGQIKSGEISGYSIGGSARRAPEEDRSAA